MTGYALCSLGEIPRTVIFHKLRSSLVRTTDVQMPAVKLRNNKIVKPLARVDGIKSLDTLENIIKYISYTLGRQN
jgi:hypothetical protein